MNGCHVPTDSLPAYDPDLPVWLLTHPAQRTDMLRACLHASWITNRPQQLAELIGIARFDPSDPTHFRTSHEGEPVKFWRLTDRIEPDPAKVALYGGAGR